MKKIFILALLLTGVLAVEVMASTPMQKCMAKYGNAMTCNVKIQQGEFK